jgi:hypothetical protein
MRSNVLEREEIQVAPQVALKFVTARRAAVLLGISESELKRISQDAGFGHTEVAGDQRETFFTYEELRKICVLSVNRVH